MLLSRTAVRTLLACGLAVIGLAWALRGLDWRALAANIAAIRWPWALLGVLANLLAYVCAGYRWHILLRPQGAIPIRRTTQAIFAGMFINGVLPLRLGEIARGYLVASRMDWPILSVIPSMALERLFEAVWLAVGIGITAIAIRLPRDLDRAADIFGLIILALVVAFLAIALRKKHPSVGRAQRADALRPPPRRLRSVLLGLAEGLRCIGLSRIFFIGAFVSLTLLVLQAASFWCFVHSFGLPLSFWTGAAVFLIITFGTALPNAPANIGSYQLFCVLGLTLFGVKKALAAQLSLTAFFLLTIPLLAVGYLALAASGTTFSALRKNLKSPLV